MKCIVELFGDDRNGWKMIAWGQFDMVQSFRPVGLDGRTGMT